MGILDIHILFLSLYGLVVSCICYVNDATLCTPTLLLAAFAAF